MSLASDEILSALLPNKQRLVATSALAHNKRYSNINHLFDSSSSTPQVATDIEKVANFQPDMVICSVFNQPQFIFALKRLQLPHLMLGKFTSINDILTNIISIGKAVQAEAQAEILVKTLKQRLSNMHPPPNKTLRKPLVLNFFADYTLMGANTMYDSIVKHAGASNVAATIVKGFRKVSIETLVTLKPDFIIVPTGIYDPLPRIQQLQGWKNLAAVKAKRFIHVPAKELLATSQYAISASEKIYVALKP